MSTLSLWDSLKNWTSGEINEAMTSIYDFQGVNAQSPNEAGIDVDLSENSGFFGSLWDSIKSGAGTVYKEVKEVVPQAVDLYSKVYGVTHPAQVNASLNEKVPEPLEIPRTDYALSTPYQRESSGSAPSTPVTQTKSQSSGISPLILIGIGAAVFLMRRKR